MSLDKKFKALEKKLIRMERMGEKTIQKNYKDTLDNLRVSMSRLYEHYEIDGQLTFEEMSKYNRLQKLDKEVYIMITSLYKLNSNVIRGTLKGIIEDAYTNTISIVDGVVEKKLKGIVKDLPVTKIINNEMAGLKWAERVGKNRADLIYDIQKEIKFGLTQGDTYGTMAGRLKKRLGVDASKANTIVRTESHRVKGEAREESFQELADAGVKFKKKWITMSDNRVRDSHASMNGVTVGRNEEFILPDGSTCRYPGEGTLPPEQSINCRCLHILELEE